MKAFAKFLCLLLVLACFTGCAAPQKSLYAQGQETALLLAEFAGNDSCLELYGADGSILSRIQKTAAADRRYPAAVYAITLAPEAQTPLAAPASTQLQSFLKNRSLSILVPQLNAAAGVEALAAGSLCTVSKTFVSREVQNAVYLYTYPDAEPVAVTFLAGEDDTVCATATFLLNPELPTDSAAALRSALSDRFGWDLNVARIK